MITGPLWKTACSAGNSDEMSQHRPKRPYQVIDSGVNVVLLPGPGVQEEQIWFNKMKITAQWQ
ncbi:hypothetical protein D1155_15265 [Anaerotruncus sp. 80]|uniref:Uncharacterized protein n=1 Tax=Anaerotruncus colihominis TaxID=169435 RepID=A0A845QMI7_9FIRM|nr:hypothetical protein [Anaerotruncus colihominis]NCF03653.1 hypothetical protein [Anaerotruncus sp. 80]